MALVGSRHAMFVLHRKAESCTSQIPNCQAFDWSGSARDTLSSLAKKVSLMNITLHLRESIRNQELAGAWPWQQAPWAGNVTGLKFAPSLAYQSTGNTEQLQELLAQGNTSIVLLSAPHPRTRCVACSEGGPLVSFDDKARVKLLEWAEMASQAGAWVVLDAVTNAYSGDGAAGREAELADVALLA